MPDHTDAPIPGRDAAWELLTTHTTQPGLLGHALAVEASMRAMARRAR